MPGMAASNLIFEHIKLPAERMECYFLEWLIPETKESISHYAKRLCGQVKHENPVLIGVSFGGMIVQEMAVHIKTRKVIVISSIKHEDEMPRRMHFARLTKVHKLLPTGLVNNIELLTKYALGVTVKSRLELYKVYLSVRDKRYLSWAIDKIVTWKHPENVKVTHIQGENDRVFPIKNMKDCIAVKGGTHVMILNRYRWFNEHLPKIIEEN